MKRDQTVSRPSVERARTKDRKGTNWGKVALGALSVLGTGAAMLAGSATPLSGGIIDLVESSSEFLDATEPAECSLVVVDYFKPEEEGKMSHGEMVTESVESVGAAGPVVRFGLGGELDRYYLDRLGTLSETLASENLQPVEARDALEQFSGQAWAAFPEVLAEDLNSMTGFENSTANFSVGADKAKIVEAVYKKLYPSWRRGEDEEEPTTEEVGEAQRRLQNLATAFSLDYDALVSEDSAVHGPVRQALQQQLIDLVDRAVDQNFAMRFNQGYWEGAVKIFEANNNSVVIAAGNSGNIAHSLQAHNGGSSVTTPEDFDKNFLATDSVTVVGATYQTKEGVPKILRAAYSSQADGTDFYAPGQIQTSDGEDRRGTSFAAPRGATALNGVHCENPEFTSDQAERFLVASYGESFDTDLGPHRRLDLELVRNELLIVDR